MKTGINESGNGTNEVASLFCDVLLLQICGEVLTKNGRALDNRKFKKKDVLRFKKISSQLTSMYHSGELDKEIFKESLYGLISYFENERLDGDALADILERARP